MAAAAWTEISSRPTKSGKRRSLARIKFYSLETIAQLSPELRTAANKALYDSPLLRFRFFALSGYLVAESLERSRTQRCFWVNKAAHTGGRRYHRTVRFEKVACARAGDRRYRFTGISALDFEPDTKWYCSGNKRRKEASFRRVPCRCFRIFLSRDSSLGRRWCAFAALAVSVILPSLGQYGAFLASAPVAYATVCFGVVNPSRRLLRGADYACGNYLYGLVVQQTTMYLFPMVRV